MASFLYIIYKLLTFIRFLMDFPTYTQSFSFITAN